MKPSGSDLSYMASIAKSLGVSSGDLYDLIKFESGWNPSAKNPYSSARGLIQWVDWSARELGYDSSEDLVLRNPTIADQLTLVKRYLDKYKPFNSTQSLYMAVFYPKARNWPPNQEFSDTVKKANPGIRTPLDYVNKAKGYRGIAGIVFAAVSAFLIYKFIGG